jgi:CP family cyanate transporter-like MFS transporter
MVTLAPEAHTDPHQTPRTTLGHAVLLGAGVVLIALNMRDFTTSLAAVLPEMMQSTGLTARGTSWLTSLPIFCFGVFGPIAPFLAKRIGIERTLLLALVVLTIGSGARGCGTIAALYAGQILSGISIGVINILLPVVVKRDFADNVGLMTGLYTMGSCIGAAVAAAATVPLMHALGGSWTAALAFWAVPVAVAAALWAIQMPAAASRLDAARATVRGVWSDPLSWQVTAFMGLQSAFAYIVYGWLAPLLRDRGLDAADAGLVVSISIVSQAAGCLLGSPIAVRSRDQRLCNVMVVLVLVGGCLAILFAPLWTVWFWAILIGLCQGAVFSLAITVIILRSADQYVATSLSGMSQTLGYILASGGPLLAGLLRGWTGSWNRVGFLFLGLGLAAAIAGYLAGRARHVRAIVVFANPRG